MYLEMLMIRAILNIDIFTFLAPLPVDRLHFGGRRERGKVGFVLRGSLFCHDLSAHQIAGRQFLSQIAAHY